MLENFRLRLAAVDALPQLSLLAVLSGLIASGVIVLFRSLVEQNQFLLLGNAEEDYTVLSPWLLVCLATGGGLLIGLLLHYAKPEQRQLGIVHVIERLSYHQAYLPFSNAVYQFFGAAICLICGHSVGREGPGVHLGAASGSLLGQWLHLPNNSLRTLVACGVAAAIAASFNTPLAGVIFSMEVVMMEYTIIGFIPVILASVVGTLVSQHFFGNQTVFQATDLLFKGNAIELIYLLFLGVFIGILAAGFIHILQWTAAKSGTYHLVWRLSLAGLITGLVGLMMPQIMGVGYVTVNLALLGELSLTTLLLLTLAKLLISSLGLGLGLPGGLIAPTLFIGAMAGGAMGALAQLWFPQQASPMGVYVMLGMGAMMSATLQAPLAALTTLLEMTLSANIIFPAMLVIVLSNIITRSPPFNKISVFLSIMRAKGLDYRYDPVAQSLRRRGVTNVMQRQFIQLPRHVDKQHITHSLLKQPIWIILPHEEDLWLLLAADVSLYLQEQPQASRQRLDLLAIPAQRQQLTCLSNRANLQQALDQLDQHQSDVLAITNAEQHIQGIVTRTAIKHHYRVDF